jgi:uncharacterized protein YjcR
LPPYTSVAYTVLMPRRKARQPLKADVFQKAKWFLSNGYSFVFIADKLGVHRNTVRAWSHKVDRHRATVNRLVRHVMKLPSHQRAVLMAKLNKRVTHG